MNATDVGKFSKKPRNVKFPCMLCEGDYLLRNCLGIPKVLEVWSIGSHQPSSLASSNHASDKPSTSKFHVKKEKFKFPYKLCEGNHLVYLCPLMDEDSKYLENPIASQPHPLTRYRKISSDPLLVDPMINQNSYLVNPTLSEREPHESILGQSLVEKMVDLNPPSVNHTFPIESEPHNSQVILVSLV